MGSTYLLRREAQGQLSNERGHPIAILATAAVVQVAPAPR